MNNAIWKYELADAGKTIVLIPRGAILRHVAKQGEELCVWAEIPDVDDVSPERMDTWEFMVTGSGWVFDDSWQWFGLWQGVQPDGLAEGMHYVWHILARVQPLDPGDEENVAAPV